ncbi:hypothetical protein [Enterobacter asburiae]|uniref:hypothetical protein n=1 Tax=Enterobacter asburiae TaxID=61645 RepID=UPI0035C5D6FB
MRNNPRKTELKVARSQRNKLRTMSAKLKEMCCEWDGLSGWLETESEQLAESIDRHLEALEDQIREWSEGTDSWPAVFINEREVMFTQKAHARQKYVIIRHNQQAFFFFTTEYLSPWHKCFLCI